MIEPGSVISYLTMCQEEGVNLQRGMNFRLGGSYSVILMSVRRGAPYADRIEENGAVLIYEGHNLTKAQAKIPETEDQPMRNPGGTLTQNGKFHDAAMRHRDKGTEPEFVRVYEKIRASIWVYNGLFHLVDAWQEDSDNRQVFKFRLEITDDDLEQVQRVQPDLEHTRMIPSSVKQEVWARDGGKCRMCGSTENLHFDHILPFSKGGTSLTAKNIQLLCAKHNLQKHDKIQ
ncbi:MAG: HNH endonuclease [Kiritimatiellales bacterium]|nr:HNH endonuclease [Kiritimatiellota bacterium]MBL7012546.1 HNH endonuclease [Kiritimatiellales bacterium]